MNSSIWSVFMIFCAIQTGYRFHSFYHFCGTVETSSFKKLNYIKCGNELSLEFIIVVSTIVYRFNPNVAHLVSKLLQAGAYAAFGLF